MSRVETFVRQRASCAFADFRTYEPVFEHRR
jgi:hypothetical protein